MSGKNDNDMEAKDRTLEAIPSPFTTTTDVMNSLNRIIMAQYQTTTNEGDNSNNEQNTPAFELQRKLPDGSSRKATPSELRAADLETKLKQVAQHVAELPNDEAKRAFGEKQRHYGNQLYERKEYEQAIDVYLTCLTIVPSERRGESMEFLQILNNLAQTALQLQWYRKAQDFCRLALEEVYACASTENQGCRTRFRDNEAKEEDHEKNDIDSMPEERRIQIAKLYFKRGKASRHRGEYSMARKDLTQALSILTAMDETATAQSSIKAIRKELQALQVAAQKGRQNQARHRQAMQQVLGGGKTTTSTEISDGETKPLHKSRTKETSSSVSEPLYTVPQGRQRPYSTLRAPSSQPDLDTHKNDDNDNDPLENLPTALRYWYYYVRVVGRVAESLLQIIGDDEGEDTVRGKEKND